MVAVAGGMVKLHGKGHAYAAISFYVFAYGKYGSKIGSLAVDSASVLIGLEIAVTISSLGHSKVHNLLRMGVA